MKWSIQFLTKLEDESLKIMGYSITRAEIEKKKGEVQKETKGKGKKKAEGIEWYIQYGWENEEQYQKWLVYVEKEVRKLNPKAEEKNIQVDVSILDMLCSPSHPYLFKTENTLF